MFNKLMKLAVCYKMLPWREISNLIPKLNNSTMVGEKDFK